MATKVKELRDIRTAPSEDASCTTCKRRPDRRYADEIWEKAQERYEREGSASVKTDK